MKVTGPLRCFSGAAQQLSSPGWHYLLLFSVIFLAAALRFYGIRWGLPDVSHPGFTYHPDEAPHLIIARYLAEGVMTNKTFMYGGTLYFTVLNAFFHFGGLFEGPLNGINRLADTVLFGRYFNILAAILTILIVYQCGRLLYGKTEGILAALLLAVMPAHIVSAQQMRPDEISALISAIVLLLACWMWEAEPGKKRRFYIYAGLAVGVAIAFRFPLGVFMFGPLVAHFLVSKEKDKLKYFSVWRDRNLILMFSSVVAGYTIASPHTFIYPDEFIVGLKVQWGYQSGPFIDAVENGPAIYQWGWSMLHEAAGCLIYFMILGGIFFALIRRSRTDVMMLFAVIPYFVLVTFTTWVVVRYMLPLLPLLALLAAGFVKYVFDSLPRYKNVSYIIFVVAVAWTLLADFAYLKMQAGTNVRDLTAMWIHKNITPGSSILIMRTYKEDLYSNPVLNTDFDVTAFGLNSTNDSKAIFTGHRFDYLILNEFIYHNIERLGDRHPQPHIRDLRTSLENSRYLRIMEFKQPIEAWGIDFSSWFTSLDYIVVNPGIRVYQYQM